MLYKIFRVNNSVTFTKYGLGNLLKLKRLGDSKDRPRITQDDTRLGFEVDYDRIIFSVLLEVCKTKHRLYLFPKQTLFIPD